MTDEYRLHGVLADLDTVHAAVSDFSRRHGLPDEVSTPLRLALDELITNAVEHGLTGLAPEQRSLVLRLSASGVDVQAVIEDNGIPFDPTPRSPPAPSTTAPAAAWACTWSVDRSIAGTTGATAGTTW